MPLPNTVQFTTARVHCTEKTDSRRETWNPKEGLSVSIDIYFEWERRYFLIDDLVNPRNIYDRAWPYTVGADEFNGMRLLPVEIAMSPIRGSSYEAGCQGINYTSGIATITYKMWTPTRESIEFQTQSIRLEPKLFKWKNEAYNDDAGMPQGLEGLSQTVTRLILVKEYDNMGLGLPYNMFGTETTTDFDASTGLIGTVHNQDYYSSIIQSKNPTGSPSSGTEFVRFKAGTLLMLDPVIQPGPQFVETPNPSGQGAFSWRRGYNYKFRWLFRPEGHNKFWRPAKENTTGKRGSWEELVLNGTGPPAEEYTPFPEMDHGNFLSNSESENLQNLPDPTPLDTECPLYDLR